MAWQGSFPVTPKLKVLELFAGIGGFALGLHNTGGFKTVAFCEINQKRWLVLNKNFPGVPIAGDIFKLSYNRQTQELLYDGTVIYTGPINVVVGGFPCQPFSVAGSRNGTDDDRHLWPEMLRLIEEIRPAWVIGENVAGITTMVECVLSSKVESRSHHRTPEYDFYEAVHTRQEKMLLNCICEDLEKIGCEVQPFVVPACAVDAKHRRDRIWIVAHTAGERCTETRQPGGRPAQRSAGTSAAHFNVADSGSDRSIGRRKRNGGNEGHQQSNTTIRGNHTVTAKRCRETLAHTDSIDAQRQQRGHSNEKKRQGPQQRPPRPQDASIGRIWPVEPGVGRVAHGIPGRVDRLEGLGNAVVPQVVEEFGYAILEAERQAA